MLLGTETNVNMVVGAARTGSQAHRQKAANPAQFYLRVFENHFNNRERFTNDLDIRRRVAVPQDNHLGKSEQVEVNSPLLKLAVFDAVLVSEFDGAAALRTFLIMTGHVTDDKSRQMLWTCNLNKLLARLWTTGNSQWVEAKPFRFFRVGRGI